MKICEIKETSNQIKEYINSFLEDEVIIGIQLM
jgi:hypothetical protein